mmetsp:Transcript_13876/g.45908  ORF Transcript_13876/g.45908 Transcript_13876/m.45908 type:complete len:500 (-) Transcript_13876:1112-2611(-)
MTLWNPSRSTRRAPRRRPPPRPRRRPPSRPQTRARRKAKRTWSRPSRTKTQHTRPGVVPKARATGCGARQSHPNSLRRLRRATHEAPPPRLGAWLANCASRVLSAPWLIRTLCLCLLPPIQTRFASRTKSYSTRPATKHSPWRKGKRRFARAAKHTLRGSRRDPVCHQRKRHTRRGQKIVHARSSPFPPPRGAPRPRQAASRRRAASRSRRRDKGDAPRPRRPRRARRRAIRGTTPGPRREARPKLRARRLRRTRWSGPRRLRRVTPSRSPQPPRAHRGSRPPSRCESSLRARRASPSAQRRAPPRRPFRPGTRARRAQPSARLEARRLSVSAIGHRSRERRLFPSRGREIWRPALARRLHDLYPRRATSPPRARRSGTCVALNSRSSTVASRTPGTQRAWSRLATTALPRRHSRGRTEACRTSRAPGLHSPFPPPLRTNGSARPPLNTSAPSSPATPSRRPRRVPRPLRATRVLIRGTATCIAPEPRPGTEPRTPTRS